MNLFDRVFNPELLLDYRYVEGIVRKLRLCPVYLIQKLMLPYPSLNIEQVQAPLA
jgi:hypothetical protein